MKKRQLTILVLLFISFSSSLFADAASDKRTKFIAAAKTYKGIPYVYGGITRSGLDCSGFVYNAARDVGISLPRTAAEMYSYATRISDSERQPGDLIFFKDGSSISHVAIYLGNEQVIHCVSDGPHTGVIESKLSENYWKTHYYCAGRIISSSKSLNDTSTVPSTATPSTKPSSSSSSKKSTATKRRKYSTILLNTDAYFDWNFFTPNEFGFLPKGGSLQLEVQTDLWDMNPGIMVRYTYPHQYNKTFALDNLFNTFTLPLCLTFHFNDYIYVYTGAVLSTGTVCPNTLELFGTEKQVVAPIYPGIFGVSFQTPRIDLGRSAQLSFVQDISYTFYKAADGYEPLSFRENLAAGLSFSTGIQIAFPF